LAYRQAYLDSPKVTEWTDFFVFREAGNVAFVVRDFPGAPILDIAGAATDVFFRCVSPL
jgi:hypothetical protein